MRSLTQTSSPRSTPATRSARCRPAVPVETATACSAPTAAASPASNAGRSGPKVSSPASTARVAASISGEPIVGSERRIRGFTAPHCPRPRPGRRAPDPAGMLIGGRSWFLRPHIGSEADNPAVWRPGCPRRPVSEPFPRGGNPCCDCRLPCRTATPRQTPRRSAPGSVTAKAELGSRLLILGHHYQRDEVIEWADMRGDSFKLARFAADNTEATDIVFCGVHFMAESADVAHRRPPARDPPGPERRVLDGRHGEHRPGRGGLGGAAPPSPTSTGSSRSRT